MFLIISSEFPPGPGGIGQHAHSLAIALAKHGQVHVLANQDYCIEAERVAFVARMPQNITFTKFFGREHAAAPLLRIKQACVWVRQHKPDKVFVSGRFPLWVGALMRLRYRKLQVFGFAHGTEVTTAGGFKAKLTHYACNMLAGMYPVSSFTGAQLGAVRYTQIVPNGLDADFLTTSAQKSAAFNWMGAPKLLTVGNLTPRKGQHRVIKALPEIVKQFPKAHYHVVGLPTEKEKLQKLAEDMRVSAHVTFHDRLASKEDLMRAYATADVFIMLSENQPNGDVEGFGIAILEANAFSKPAIGAKGCGIEDAIANHSGVLVDGDNDVEIVAALKKIMNEYPKYAHAARSWAESHNWESLVQKLLA